MIELNEGQQRVVKELLDPKVQGITVIGEGGTGKTTCVMWAVKDWIAEGKAVLLIAPTNKAVKQLSYSAKNLGLSVDALTIHKSLGLALLPTDERKFPARMGQGTIGNYQVVVVDESSMIPKVALQEYLLPEIIQNKIKVIFMGDDMQLPPIKETRSEALNVYPAHELTQVERFDKESGIAKLTTLLRSHIKNNTGAMIDLENFDVERVPQAMFDKVICELFSDPLVTVDNTRVLAWSNSRVNEINRKIREHIYGKGAPMYVEGERIVLGAPLVDEHGQTLMVTDEEGTVTAMSESFVTSPESGKDYPVWVVAVTPEGSQNSTVFCNVLKAAAYDQLQDELSYYKKKALESGNRGWWKKFHDTKDLFADVRYCYCITVHRSQGSTFQTVAVDAANILKNYKKDERRKLLYVATSRASQRLILNQKKLTL